LASSCATSSRNNWLAVGLLNSSSVVLSFGCVMRQYTSTSSPGLQVGMFTAGNFLDLTTSETYWVMWVVMKFFTGLNHGFCWSVGSMASICLITLSLFLITLNKKNTMNWHSGFNLASNILFIRIALYKWEFIFPKMAHSSLLERMYSWSSGDLANLDKASWTVIMMFTGEWTMRLGPCAVLELAAILTST